MDLPYLRNAGGDGAGAGPAMERMNRSKIVLGKGHTFESGQAPHFTKLFFSPGADARQWRLTSSGRKHSACWLLILLSLLTIRTAERPIRRLHGSCSPS